MKQQISQQINLFNPIFLKQEKYFSAIAMAQGLGLILVGVFLIIAYIGYQVSSMSKTALVVTAQQTSAQNQLVRLSTEFGQRKKDAQLETNLAKMEVELAGLKRLVDITQNGNLGNAKGYSEYFRAFSRQSVPGLWLTGFGIAGAGTDIVLSGNTLRPELVPSYVSRLQKESIMAGLSFSSLEMQLPKIAPAGSDPAESKPVESMKYIEFTLRSAPAVSAVKDKNK